MERCLRTTYKVFRLLLATLALLAFQKSAYGPPAPFYNPNWQCLVSAVYHEARGEPAKGKRAVLDVIVNRAKAKGISYCEVIAEPGQFSFMRKRDIAVPVDFDITDVLRESSHIMCATHYHNLSVSPGWAKRLTYIGRIGSHKFYGEGTCVR